MSRRRSTLSASRGQCKFRETCITDSRCTRKSRIAVSIERLSPSLQDFHRSPTANLGPDSGLSVAVFTSSLHQLDRCGCVIPWCALTVYYSRTHTSCQGGNTCFSLRRRFCSAIGAICCHYVNSSKSGSCQSRITMAKRTQVSGRL